jgi:hypothetical protein
MNPQLSSRALLVIVVAVILVALALMLMVFSFYLDQKINQHLLAAVAHQLLGRIPLSLPL